MSKKMIIVECKKCFKKFEKSKAEIKRTKNNFCSERCSNEFRSTSKEVTCEVCKKNIKKSLRDIKRTKHNFCSRSCSATYHNKHKTIGIRKSKLEIFLEEKLRSEFPKLEILTNDKTAIESELDFYFPSLKLGIEINGIFHYEPIFGEDKLKKIKNNDNRKLIACYEHNIELIVIPTIDKFQTQKSKEKYWTGIKEIISSKLQVQNKKGRDFSLP